MKQQRGYADLSRGLSQYGVIVSVERGARCAGANLGDDEELAKAMAAGRLLHAA